MTHECEDFADLACGLIQNTLSAEKKSQVQRLVMESPEFLEALKLELALKNKVASLKEPLSDSAKLRVYVSIADRSHELLCKKVFQTVLQATLPRITWPVLGLLERSVFANEQL